VRLVERMHAYQEDQLGQLSERKQELLSNEEGGAIDEEQLLAIEQLMSMTRRISRADVQRVREDFYVCYQHFHLHYGPELNAMKEWEAKRSEAAVANRTKRKRRK
jgi:DNA-binding transcriptional regulator YiaG